MRSLRFEGDSWSEYEKLRITDKKAHKKLCQIIKEMLRSDDLEVGIGKPEKLRYDLSGYWSRRLTQAQRVVYWFDDSILYITAIGGHYDD
jgi:toxin YoeB